MTSLSAVAYWPPLPPYRACNKLYSILGRLKVCLGWLVNAYCIHSKVFQRVCVGGGGEGMVQGGQLWAQTGYLWAARGQYMG